MKKPISLLWATFLIVPLFLQTGAILKTNHQWQPVTLKTSDLKQKLLDDSGNVQWQQLQQAVDQEINQVSKSNGHQPNSRTVTIVKNQVTNVVTDMASHQVPLNQVTDYLANKYPDFQNNYLSPQNAISNLDDQIINQYFGTNKIDLQLDGSQTYQDALDAIVTKINQNYQNNDLKFTLTDPHLASKTLFDDSSTQTIRNFVNNNIRINLTATNANHSTTNLVLSLTNLQLKPLLDQKQLFEAVQSYFGADQTYDLNLDASQTIGNAIDAINQKIAKRFNINVSQDCLITGSPDHIGITTLDDQNATFLDPNYLSQVFNQNFQTKIEMVDLYLKQPDVKPPVDPLFNGNLALTNIHFDLDQIKSAISNLFNASATNSNLQTIGLTTQNTFADVVTKINQRLSALNEQYHFTATLTDSSQASQLLETEYHPGATNNDFFVNLNITFQLNQQTEQLGTFTIHLANVLLDNTDKAVLTAYNHFQDSMTKLNDWNTGLSITTAILATASAAFAAAAVLDFGETAPEAVACAVAAGVVGSINGVIGIIIYNGDQDLTYWNRIELGVSSIYAVAQTFYAMLVPVLLAGETTLGFVEWAFPVIVATIAVAEAIYACVTADWSQ